MAILTEARKLFATILVCLVVIETSARSVHSNMGSKLCKTRECEMLRSKIHQLMNTEVDPCDDFEEFACGGLKRSENLDGLAMSKKLDVKESLQSKSSVDSRRKGLRNTHVVPRMHGNYSNEIFRNLIRRSGIINLSWSLEELLGNLIRFFPADLFKLHSTVSQGKETIYFSFNINANETEKFIDEIRSVPELRNLAELASKLLPELADIDFSDASDACSCKMTDLKTTPYFDFIEFEKNFPPFQFYWWGYKEDTRAAIYPCFQFLTFLYKHRYSAELKSLVGLEFLRSNLNLTRRRRARSVEDLGISELLVDSEINLKDKSSEDKLMKLSHPLSGYTTEQVQFIHRMQAYCSKRMQGNSHGPLKSGVKSSAKNGEYLSKLFNCKKRAT